MLTMLVLNRCFCILYINFQHTALVGGPNPACCPLCQKLCVSGESLMEHMKYVHKDPNASGVPGKSIIDFNSCEEI